MRNLFAFKKDIKEEYIKKSEKRADEYIEKEHKNKDDMKKEEIKNRFVHGFFEDVYAMNEKEIIKMLEENYDIKVIKNDVEIEDSEVDYIRKKYIMKKRQEMHGGEYEAIKKASNHALLARDLMHDIRHADDESYYQQFEVHIAMLEEQLNLLKKASTFN